MENIEDVRIIDLANKRILDLDPEKKKAIYTDLNNSPLMPNQLDLIKGVIKTLENAPGFVVEQLGEKEIDGQLLYGFRAKHSKMNVVIYVDPQTALPVYMEWEGRQMKTICRNIRFNVPMDESLFSMEAPIGYKIERQRFDPFGSTEEDFIEDLRIEADVLGDGVFPDDVSVEHFIKMTPVVKEKLDKLQKSEDEKTALVLKLHKGLMFIRYFKGEGNWIYAGKGVKLGDANTPVFWYRPTGSETYHVIYGDLTVEDVNENDLPKPVENQ
jgi:hypothetical protein